jgi:hypothetical protein
LDFPFEEPGAAAGHVFLRTLQRKEWVAMLEQRSGSINWTQFTKEPQGTCKYYKQVSHVKDPWSQLRQLDTRLSMK